MFFSLFSIALVLQQQGRSHLVEAGPIPGAVAVTTLAYLFTSHDGTHAPKGLVADALETKAPVAGRHGGGDGSAFELELHPERGSSEEAGLVDFAKYVTGDEGRLMDTKEDGTKIGLRGTESGTAGDVHLECGLPGGALCGKDGGIFVWDTGCFKDKENSDSCDSGYKYSDCCGLNNCIRNENNGGFTGSDDYYCSESPPSPPPSPSPTLSPYTVCQNGGGLSSGTKCGEDGGAFVSDSGCYKDRQDSDSCDSGYKSSACCGPSGGNGCIRNENNGGWTGTDDYYCEN